MEPRIQKTRRVRECHSLPHFLETGFRGAFQPAAEFFRAYRLNGLISSRTPSHSRVTSRPPGTDGVGQGLRAAARESGRGLAGEATEPGKLRLDAERGRAPVPRRRGRAWALA